MRTETTKQEIRNRHGLIFVICGAIILISLAATISVSWINYQKYRDAVMDVHADYAAGIGQMVESSLYDDEWLEITGKIEQWNQEEISDADFYALEDTDSFQYAYEQGQLLTDGMALSNVTVFTIDMQGMASVTKDNFIVDETGFMTFMMDFYPSDCDDPTYELGDIDIWWSDFEGFAVYRDFFDEIVSSKEPDYMEEVLGDGTVLLSTYYPIFCNGNFTAMVLVSQSIQDIDTFVNSFFVQTLLIGLGITALLIALAIVFFYWRIVRPLRIISKEAVQFVSGDALVSKELSKIRTRDEIQQLAESFLKMENDLQHYINQVEKVTAEKEHIRTELGVATRIQEDMLPRVFPPYPDRKEFSIFASMDPAKEVGGDFYDFFFIDQDHLALVIADVAGKGVPASLFMVIAKTLIKNRSQLGGTPSEILSDVNTQLCDGNDENMFVTVWMAIIDLRTGKGIAANAGHEHPVRRDQNGEYHLVEYRHSPAVAVFDTMKFRQHDFELKPGDRIFVYTDGLPEATNAQDQLYGTERMLCTLNNHQDAPLADILPLITKDVADFVGEAPQFDDLTMLAFEYHGTAAEESSKQ